MSSRNIIINCVGDCLVDICYCDGWQAV